MENVICNFCFSFQLSKIEIILDVFPQIKSTCYLGHEKTIFFTNFFEKNSFTIDNSNLQINCPFCNEKLSKDVFFINPESKKLICPTCIAINIITSSSKKSSKKSSSKKTKIKKEEKKDSYVTLVSLLKGEQKEKIDFSFIDDKILSAEKIFIDDKYKDLKEIIINEREQNILNKIYELLINYNQLKQRLNEIYKNNKGFLSNYFYNNISYIYSYNNIIKELFENNFQISLKVQSKEFYSSLQKLHEYIQNKQDTFNKIFYAKKILNDTPQIVYRQESIISNIIVFTFENENHNNEKFFILSSNDGLINILDIKTYKILYTMDIFEKRGVYYLTQSKNIKNTFYASSWGCIKQILLTKGENSFYHSIINTYRKKDIIRILKLIEVKNDILSLDEGGHIIAWGYDKQNKRITKMEIFVSDREDSINNFIYFQSNKLRNMLIFTTRSSTSLGTINFYDDENYEEIKLMKNSYKKKQISFDLQYNSLSQINDYLIAFPQNNKIVIVDIKCYQILSFYEMQIYLERDKFYNEYGETVKILKMRENNNSILIFSSKGYVLQYLLKDRPFGELIYIGKMKYKLNDKVESIINISEDIEKNENKLQFLIQLNKEILLLS